VKTLIRRHSRSGPFPILTEVGVTRGLNEEAVDVERSDEITSGWGCASSRLGTLDLLSRFTRGSWSSFIQRSPPEM